MAKDTRTLGGLWEKILRNDWTRKHYATALVTPKPLILNYKSLVVLLQKWQNSRAHVTGKLEKDDFRFC
jgi:hypothetical protein